MRNKKLVVAVVAVALLLAACGGGKSAEEELLEQILESSGEDIGDIDINTDSDGNLNITVEGEDGESINITGLSGEDDGNVNISVEGDQGESINVTGNEDDEQFTITVEGDDGGTLSIGSGEIPEGLQLPVVDGGSVITSFTSGQDMSVSLIYPGSAYDQLVSFYESQLPSGDDVIFNSSTFTDNDGTHRGATWIGGTFLVSVTDCQGMNSSELDSACVMLSQFSS